MSEKPVPENLISDYLDNQLTPAEREQAERLFQSHPELSELKNAISMQSEQIKALPRFELGGDLTERILAAPSAEKMFSEMTGLDRLATRSASYQRSRRFGIAFSAIASLAAMVLITISIQSNRLPPSAASVSKLATESIVDEEVLEETMDKAMPGKRSSRKDGGEFSDENEGAENFFARDKSRNQIAASQNPSVNQIEKNVLDLKEGAIGNENSKKSPGGGLANSGESRSKMKSDTAIDSFAAPSQIADRAFEQSRLGQVKPESGQMDLGRNEDDRGMETPDDDLQDQIDSSIVGNRWHADGPALEIANQVGQIVEIEFSSDGPVMIEELQRALDRNAIVLDETPDAESLAIGGREQILGGQGGFGGGGGGLSEKSAPKSGFFESVKQQQGVDSLALMVTTTPQQMGNLLSDLKKQARVESYEFEAMKNERMQMLTQSLNLENDGASELSDATEKLAGRKRKPAMSKLAEAKNQPKSENNKQALSFQAIRGIAQPGQKSSLTRNATDPEAASEDARSGNAMPKLKKDITARIKNQPGIPRHYFLIVRGSGESGKTVEASQEAIPAAPSANARQSVPDKKD